MRVSHRPLFSCFLLATLACTPSDGQSKPDGQAKTQPPAKSSGDAPVAPGEEAGEADEAGQTPEPTPEPPADLIREAPGVDLSKLPETKHDAFFQVINTESSACGQPHSLAVSLRDDDSCRNSMHVAQFIADRMVAGAAPGDIKLEIDALAEALTAREIPIEGRPVWGNERAPVTVVVFADFQCPICKAEAPVLREGVEDQKGRAKLVFKHFPLTHHHPRAEAAALAAEAAHRQGKFWEMHDLLFTNQDALSDEDLAGYAARIDGLDVAKWKADLASDEVKLAVAQDRADGEKLDLPGTPTVYVDGREVVPLLWGGELDGWIEDALMR